MNAFFVVTLMIVFSAMADAYQVFATTAGAVHDRYAEGVWADTSFIHVPDDIDHADFQCSGGGGPIDWVEFSFPLNTGDPQDLQFIPGQTYNLRFARGDVWNTNPLQMWSSVYSFTVPAGISASWQDSISAGGIQGVRWRRESVTNLRIRMWWHWLPIDYSFMVLERPNSQDLSPTTWGSVKSAF